MIKLKELIELKSMVYSEEIKPKHKKKMNRATPSFHEGIVLPKIQPPDNDSICHSISNTFGASPTTWQNPDNKPHGPWTHWRKDPLPPQRICWGYGWMRRCQNVSIPMTGKQNCNTSPNTTPNL